jgi:hypothetical protein
MLREQERKRGYHGQQPSALCSSVRVMGVEFE